MDILTKTFQKYAQGHAQVAQHTDSNWAIFLKPFAKSPSLGEEERNSCSQKITAVMFSRQNLVHALVKISFARGSCFSSFLYIKLTKKFVHERRYLIRKINFFLRFFNCANKKSSYKKYLLQVGENFSPDWHE